MNKYNIILFDLDGTITDSKPGIIKSIQYALSNLNIIEEDIDKLQVFIGPPLRESFIKHYNLNGDSAKDAHHYYREYYKDKGLFENELYDGIEELLQKLKSKNKKMFIATSKPTIFAKKVIEYFNIEKYFDMIVGSNLDGTMTNKADVIKFILDRIGNVPPNEIVMVGDREYDIIGAANNSIDSIGVKYGYALDTELESVNPTYLVKDIDELTQLLLDE